MSVRVRFAPSPTGHLHVGGARTALYNYLFARRAGGVFVLRIEDTDAQRSTEESVRGILDSLRWLGLAWDEGPEIGGGHGPYFQSQRLARYRACADRLLAAGNAYACYCTPEELEARRTAQIASGESPRYDGRCRRLDDDARVRLAGEGRPTAIRFTLPVAGETAWDDVVRGRVAFQNDVLDDFVLLRSDGHPTYNFACVVDDHEMAISHVIRGDDHISNTPRQILLFQALGLAPPVFAHASMILGADGTRLSKRHGATSVAAFQDLGYLPEAMANFLALLGWAYDGERELFTLAELERLFELERVKANPAFFNLEKLEWMNGQHLKRLDEAERIRRVEAFLAGRGISLADRTPEWRAVLVRAIGDRLKTLADAERYVAFLVSDLVTIVLEAWASVRDRPDLGSVLEALADRLESDAEYSLASLEREMRALAAERGLKLGDVVAPARVAVTGECVSFGIFETLWLLGRERAVERVRQAAARWSEEVRAGRLA
ncbi:MAG TPA: glutamate--tRNA ligase [Candidatus Limnocylindria bacterium]|nr:glutamate--tRNA ligase [Candidatus Limnocylindria bacterium]